MSHRHDELPEDLHGVDRRLRASRPDIDPLRLDQIKQQVLHRSDLGTHRGALLKSRLATMLTIAGLLGGTGGAVALAGGPSSTDKSKGASHGEYCEGKQKPGTDHCEYPPPPPKKDHDGDKGDGHGSQGGGKGDKGSPQGGKDSSSKKK